MPLSNLEVGMVVPGCNRHHPCSKLGVNRLVLDNSSCYLAIDPFSLERVAMFILGITLVIRVHNYILITKLGLWPSCTDLERPILQRVELPLLFLVCNLIIGHVSFKIRIPINYAVTSVNQTVMVHFDKCLVNAAVQGFVQGIAQARPIGAGTDSPHLGK